jgi:hypothetical protein
MIGERHWVREEPVFLQNLIRRCFEDGLIDVLFLEIGGFGNQGQIDAFLASPDYDPKPVLDVLRQATAFGWGYQEYLDIFKLVYEENHKRPPSERIRLVLADSSLDGHGLEMQLYQGLKPSPIPEEEKWKIVSWIRASITDRDRFMADTIEAYLADDNLDKAIYYAGGHHVRKDLRSKDFSRRLFSTGGLLSRKYPQRVCSLALHKSPEWWQDNSSFDYLERLFQSHGKSFAIDSNDPRVNHLKLKGDIAQEGLALHEVFDGYIMLNRDKDYNSCTLIPGFYTDEFAKEVWERLRKEGLLQRLPSELSQWKDKAWTGEELTKLIEAGLR